jgi:molybdopterin/thiamine biosynthesis adenylyltransferase
LLEQFPLKGLTNGGPLLSQRRVIVFGAGGVGGVAVQMLAQCGVGTIDVVDPDSFGPESFLTQRSFWTDVGRPKAVVHAERCRHINPAVRVRAFVGFAQDVLLRELRKADLFLVCGDNLALPIWAARAAVALRKIVIQGAVYGEFGNAIVRAYDLRDPSGTCPMCGLHPTELQNQYVNRGRCSLDGQRTTGAPPTRTLPTICTAAGAMAANEALKWLTGHEDALHGGECQFSLLTYASCPTMVPRDDKCNLPHEAWTLADMPAGPHQTTMAELAAQLAGPRDPGSVQVQSEIPWVGATICSCGREHAVRRFGRRGVPLGRCDCGATLTTARQENTIVPLADLRVSWERPLAELGLGGGEVICLTNDGQWTCFFLPEADGK